MNIASLRSSVRNAARSSTPDGSSARHAGGKDFDHHPLTSEGKVIRFTRLWAIPEGIEQLPLTIAIVEFDGKVRVTAQVLGEEIRTRDRVRPIWGQIRKIKGREV